MRGRRTAGGGSWCFRPCAPPVALALRCRSVLVHACNRSSERLRWSCACHAHLSWRYRSAGGTPSRSTCWRFRRERAQVRGELAASPAAAVGCIGSSLPPRVACWTAPTAASQEPAQQPRAAPHFRAAPWPRSAGFVWDKQGHIVTNYHVIRGASDVLVGGWQRLPGTAPPSRAAAVLLFPGPAWRLLAGGSRGCTP